MNTMEAISPVNHAVRPSQPRKRILLWGRRVLLTLLALAVLGASYQAIAAVSDARTYSPPGQRIDVGGYKLHIYCTGPTNTGNPTVILEAGLGATAAVWGWIQPEVAKTTRVCAYDRAGMGFSDASQEAYDAQHIAQRLHTLLHHANIAGPYVLVGWSFGGLYVRSYADQYGPEVAGLVLLDSSDPDQCSGSPAMAAQCKLLERIYTVAPVLARLGVMRVISHFQATPSLPAPQSAYALASFAATKDWEAQSAEFLAAPATNAQVRAARALGSTPLVVVTAAHHGNEPDMEELWQGWQQEMANLSTNSLHRVVAGSSHASLVSDEKDAQASSAAIRQVIEAVRSGKPVADQEPLVTIHQ